MLALTPVQPLTGPLVDEINRTFASPVWQRRRWIVAGSAGAIILAAIAGIAGVVALAKS